MVIINGLYKDFIGCELLSIRSRLLLRRLKGGMKSNNVSFCYDCEFVIVRYCGNLELCKVCCGWWVNFLVLNLFFIYDV